MTFVSKPSASSGDGNFNFEVAAPNCYAAAMSRKTPSDPGHGFNDIIGVALLAAALLLLVAQLSFDRYDLAFIHTPPNKPMHNWIGPFGAHVAYASFFLFGLGAFVLPFLLAAFGLGYLFNFLVTCANGGSGPASGASVMMLSLTGLLHIMDRPLQSFARKHQRTERGRLVRLLSPIRLRFLDAWHGRRNHCLCDALPHQPAVPDRFPARRLVAPMV